MRLFHLSDANKSEFLILRCGNIDNLVVQILYYRMLMVSRYHIYYFGSIYGNH